MKKRDICINKNLGFVIREIKNEEIQDLNKYKSEVKEIANKRYELKMAKILELKAQQENLELQKNIEIKKLSDLRTQTKLIKSQREEIEDKLELTFF